MSSNPAHDPAENTGVLPGLPGSDTVPGQGPAVDELFAHLLDDAALLLPQPAGLTAAVRSHDGHAAAWYRDLLGALALPPAAATALAAELDQRAAAGTRSPVRVCVVADPDAVDPLAEAAQAATTLDARDDVQVVALEVALPRQGDQGAAAADLSGRLALATPRPDVQVWVEVHRTPGWLQALQVLARAGDGVGATLRTGGSTAAAYPSVEDLAAMLRGAVDVEVAVRLAAGPQRAVRGIDHAAGVVGHGLLNVLGALRAALNGAEVPEVAGVLASTDPAALASGARRMSEPDAAVLRAFWHSLGCGDVAGMVHDLAALGLLRGSPT